VEGEGKERQKKQPMTIAGELRHHAEGNGGGSKERVKHEKGQYCGSEFLLSVGTSGWEQTQSVISKRG